MGKKTANLYRKDRMKEKILWITPSRKRDKKLRRTIDSWRETTTGQSDFLVAIDNDDNSYAATVNEYKDVIWEIGEPINGPFLHLVNRIALKYQNEYQYLGFMEDDVIFRTPGYENRFIEKLKELGEHGIVYADDNVKKHLVRGLIGLPVLNSNIVKKLGFYSPPCLKCLCGDLFWRDMAKHLGSYYRFDDIMIEHMHWKRDDKIVDETTESVNSHLSADNAAYQFYVENNFLNDMAKLR